MKKKIFLLTIIMSFFLVFSLASIFAITGSIGNSRMVLRLDPGEEIEKYILVKNVNDVPLTIELSAGGDLEENIQIQETSFTLAPLEEKKAYFTIKADKKGTTESKVNVKFTPQEGNAVGLSATIIVISSEDGSADATDDEVPEVDEDGISISPSNSTGKSNSSISISPAVLIMMTSTLILLIAFIVIYVYSKKIKLKKSASKFAP